MLGKDRQSRSSSLCQEFPAASLVFLGLGKTLSLKNLLEYQNTVLNLCKLAPEAVVKMIELKLPYADRIRISQQLKNGQPVDWDAESVIVILAGEQRK